MEEQVEVPGVGPARMVSAARLSVEMNANGSLRRMACDDIILNLFPGNEVEGGPANVFLRRLGNAPEATPLLGPGSPATYLSDGRTFVASGTWGDLSFRVRLVLAEAISAWFWHVDLENTGLLAVSCDLIHTQDLALAHYGALRLNEYYVSQYVDHTPLEHPQRGVALASRQNLSMGGRWPWTVIGSLGRGVSYATDALQFHGLATRAGRPAPGLTDGLPGRRHQHEHSMAAIQDEAFTLAPGGRIQRGFFGRFEADKPRATSLADVVVIDAVLALPEAIAPAWIPGECLRNADKLCTLSGERVLPAECPDHCGAGISHATNLLQPVLAEPSPADWFGVRPADSLFASAPILEALDLEETEIRAFFGDAPRHEEREDGQLLSFFTSDMSHVVFNAKELKVLRPHGHLLRSGGPLTPDESALTSTAWMAGVFHSMVTQGHVSINRFLSTCHTYLGLFRSHGQRVFVEIDGRFSLLGTPSAFEMAAASCRWIYKHQGGLIEVVASAPAERHELSLAISVLAGPAARFLISHHVAINGDDGSSAMPLRWDTDDRGVFVRPVPDCDVGRRFPDGGFRIVPAEGGQIETIGGDELLFADGICHGQPFLCIVTAPALTTGLVIEGCLVDAPGSQAGKCRDALETCLETGGSDEPRLLEGCPGQVTRAFCPPPQADVPLGVSIPGHSRGSGLQLSAPPASRLAPAAARVAEILPWLIHNALVHYLSPRGLEQYSGGGWGTRDVCQGPLELLLALGRFEPLRDLLCRVFRQQNPDGDWPQWFMFFERERHIRAEDSHADIVYWPILALAQYLSATGDAGLLDETLPFFHGDGEQGAEQAGILQHVDRALDLIRKRVIAGTRLAAYGHGDWNDSLQPAKPEMRERLCSAWTVTLNYQTFRVLADAFRQLGHVDRAVELDAMASNILDEFQRVLIVDDVVAGLVYFHADGKTEPLLHPGDDTTGLSYSLLPMVHAIINDMLTPQQAENHLGLIQRHLLGPDGAHLFDRPLAYHGGPQTFFQRAESASYFGREIGLMYTHAHLRYCEALARFGDAEAFFNALCQANPIALRELVPTATLRQANCYYSSSDPAFRDRYEASDEYDKVRRGEVALEGGWRVYSSGAGISVRLIVRCFLGLRVEKSALVVDPVMPAALDGVAVRTQLAGRAVEIVYRISGRGCGPVSINFNGADLEFVREPNPYRPGAARVAMEDIVEGLTGSQGLYARIIVVAGRSEEEHRS